MHKDDLQKTVNIALFYICLLLILFVTLGCTMVVHDGSKLSVDPLTRNTYPPVAHRLP
jgi:hypothetical protein